MQVEALSLNPPPAHPVDGVVHKSTSQVFDSPSSPTSPPSTAPNSPLKKGRAKGCAECSFAANDTNSTPALDSSSGTGGRKRVLIISDCARDLVCGVTRKQYMIQKSLIEAHGMDCRVITPDSFWGFRCPRWEEIKVALPSPYSYRQLAREIEAYNPDMINIITEGPLGMMASLHCTINGRLYTTMRCSRFDLYLAQSVCRPAGAAARACMDWFHSWSQCCITPSPSMAEILRPNTPRVAGIMNGCDTTNFTTEGPMCPEMEGLARPIWLFAGRVCREKNIDALLELTLAGKLEGTVCIVGAGPDLPAYQEKYSEEACKTPVKFLGWKSGKDLEACYRSGDVFVFPSLTDTFGQVMVEAMASGLPVAAFPVTGPIDVVADGVCGALREDLLEACHEALRTKDVAACVKHAKSFSWDTMSQRFLDVQPTKDANSLADGSIRWLVVMAVLMLAMLWVLVSPLFL